MDAYLSARTIFPEVRTIFNPGGGITLSYQFSQDRQKKQNPTTAIVSAPIPDPWHPAHIRPIMENALSSEDTLIASLKAEPYIQIESGPSDIVPGVYNLSFTFVNGEFMEEVSLILPV